MSAFAYCRDCREVTTGVMDLAKGFQLGQETNHIGCRVEYLDPASLPRPIASLIARLAIRPESVTDTDITMFRLGLEMHDYPTGSPCLPAPSTAPDATSTSTTSPATALRSDASTRSPRASRPTSVTPAREPDLLDLIGGVA